MRYLYNTVLYLALPLILLRLLWKARKNPSYNQRWNERFAKNKTEPLANSIWIHAVSVGESIAATPLIKKLQITYPDTPIVVTTMTPTGSERIQKTFGKKIHHFYVPYDYPHTIKRFLNQINPQLIVIMETELWPNILHYSSKRKIPIILANARLSKHSAQGYQKLARLTKQMLQNINIVATQSQLDAQRFINLGASRSQTKVTGNIKFDISIPEELPIKATELRREWGTNRPIWVAASTHAGEEEQILAAHKIIKQSIPNALLVLVPRHPERFNSVTKLCKQKFNIIKCSLQQTCTSKTDIIIGDTMGELLLFYAAADLAFVGGSLVETGGHNLLEPAAVNIPIISGPHLFNFTEISKLLLNAKALIITNNANELATHAIKLLENKPLSNQRSEAAQKVVKQNRGSLDKIMALIKNLL